MPTIIVTGASRGIGRSVVLQALTTVSSSISTTNVIGVARNGKALSELATFIESELKLPNRFKYLVGDVTDPSTSTNLLGLTASSWSGELDGIVLNAGVLEPISPIGGSSTVEDWKKCFDVNFFSILHTVQVLLPLLRCSTNGKVIMVSSGAAKNPYHGWGSYCTSKAALLMLGNVLATEEPDLTVINVAPGVVATDMQKSIRENGKDQMRPEQYKRFVDLHQTEALLNPDLPGRVLASLAVSAEKSLSGQMFSWNDPALSEHNNKA